MKNKSILLTTVIAIAVVGPPAYAKDSSAQGRPFAALQEQVDANRLLIEANSTAIDELGRDTAAILERIDAVEASMADLSDQVAENSNEIDNVLDQVTTTSGEIDALYSELSSLASRHEADLAGIGSQLTAIEAELENLNQLRNELAEDLRATLQGLDSQVTDNAVAIDSLLLQLVNANAQLTMVNSDIMNLENRSSDLEEAQAAYGEQLTQLTELVAGLEGRVDTLEGYHQLTFSGIQTNLPVASLQGWSQCYSALYSAQDAHPESMVAACTGNKIMLACRRVGSDTLSLAAYANREDVFLNTGDNNDYVHRANGVDWYFSYNWSMGFVPAGAGVHRNSGDVSSSSPEQRLSWHTKDYYTAGWRCGNALNLNRDSNWEKLIYQAD